MGKKGIVFGCFDPLHAGHVRLIRACRERCDHLTVLVHSDGYIKNEKGRDPFFDETSRMADVIELRSADLVMLNSRTDRNEWIRALHADVMFASEQANPDDFVCEVVNMPRTPKISSTMLRGG